MEAKDDTKRIIVENSQIYILDLSFLSKCQFFNPAVKGRTSINQFSLVKMAVDTRPILFIYFSILTFPMLKKNNNSTKDVILLFGGDNRERVTYIFDDAKREICKCSVFTGDVDRFATNCLWQNDHTVIAFGLTRMHIFEKKLKKFTGAKVYDFEMAKSVCGKYDS